MELRLGNGYGWPRSTVPAKALTTACSATAVSPSDVAGNFGPRAETWVYLYASCDREAVYPELGAPGPLRFRDRFTGRQATLPEEDAAVLAELTAANELDIVTVNPAWGAQMAPGLLDLLGAARHRLSEPVWEACASTLGGGARRS
jgi:hypothetical protein